MKIRYLILDYMKLKKLMKRTKRMESLDGVQSVEKEQIIIVNPKEFQSVVMNVNKLIYFNQVISK